MSNRVVHFEVQADDVQRAKDFYEKALGWKIEQVMKKEDGGMDYWLIYTGQGPGIDGGLYQRPSDDDKSYLYDCTVAVPDIDAAIESVKTNGGQITREKSHLEGVGWFARVKDPEGNSFGLMQSTMKEPK